MNYNEVIKTISLLSEKLKREYNDRKITFFYEDCGSYNFVLNFEVERLDDYNEKYIESFELYYTPDFVVPYENSDSYDFNEIIEYGIESGRTEKELKAYYNHDKLDFTLDYIFYFLNNNKDNFTIESEIILSDTPDGAFNEIENMIERFTQ